MNLQNFFKVQDEANKLLVMDKTLNDYKLTARKLLSLHVKLSDLANETKCFRYWEEEDNSPSKDAIMTKYIDCLSHILTIGLDKNYSDLKEVDLNPNDDCLSDQFLNLFIDLNDIIISPSKDHYQTLFEDFMTLGISLGYSESIIDDKYHSKMHSFISSK